MSKTSISLILLALLFLCACAPSTAAPQTDTASITAAAAAPEPSATPVAAEAPETLEELQADLATASLMLSNASQYSGGYYYYLMRGANVESVLIRFSDSLESEVVYRGGLNIHYTVQNGAVYILDTYNNKGVTRILPDGEAECISMLEPEGSNLNSWYYVSERYLYLLHAQYGGRILRIPNDPAFIDWYPPKDGEVDTTRCLCLTDADEKVCDFVPYEGYLYYSRSEGESGISLWRVLPDGTGKELVCGDVSGGTLCVDDDGRLYYATSEYMKTDIELQSYYAPGRKYLQADGSLAAADFTVVYSIGADADYLYYDGGLMQVKAQSDGQFIATKHENAKGYRVSRATGEKDLTYGVNLYWYQPVGDYLINQDDALMIPKAGGEPAALPGSEQIQNEIELYARVPSVLIGGEGPVELELSGSSAYAVYYLLYNSDDVTPGHEVRAVYLNHTNSGSMYFPEGNYVLKIARGDYWISDEVGFGESGSYSKSIPKEMTAGVYFIEESTSSGFDSDSWGGLG